MNKIAALLLLLAAFVTPAYAQTTPSLTLEWNAPGDDGLVGTASFYDLRWSSTRPDTTSQAAKDTWWAAATVVSGMPVPLVSGTLQSKTVSPTGGFAAGSAYYFVIRASDEAGNESGWSNVAWRFLADTTAPSPPTNLRVR